MFLLSKASTERLSLPRLPRGTPSSVVLPGRGEDPAEYKWIWASVQVSCSPARAFPRTQPGLCSLSKFQGQLSLWQPCCCQLLPSPETQGWRELAPSRRCSEGYLAVPEAWPLWDDRRLLLPSDQLKSAPCLGEKTCSVVSWPRQ